MNKQLKESFKKLLAYVRKHGFYYSGEKSGICHSLVKMYYDEKSLTEDEYRSALKYLHDNMPIKPVLFFFGGRHSKFTKQSYTGKTSSFWWERNAEGNDQRIQFIKYLITKLDEEAS